MITEMKKLDLLLYHREQEQFLTSLRDAGVVHVSERYDALSPEAEKLRGELISVDRVISELKRRKAQAGSTESDGETLLALYEKSHADRDHLQQKLANVHKDLGTLEPWGNFDPAQIEKLRKRKVLTRFFEISDHQLALFEGIPFELIHKKGSTCWIVTVEQNETKLIAGIDPLLLPDVSLETLKAELRSIESAIVAVEKTLDQIAGNMVPLTKLKTSVEEALHHETARISMVKVAENKILHLEGWVPVDKTANVATVLSDYSCWYEFSKPAETDAVPVKMKNAPGFRLFESITKIFALPNYFEIDPTPFFAPFYALFFGLCLGDVGYGSLLVILALIGMAKFPIKARPVMVLGVVLGISTMISGVLLNSFFGAPLFAGIDGKGILDGSYGGIAFLKSVEIDGKTIFPAMAFSVYLGMIQIMLGILLKAANNLRSNGFVYALYPIGTILLVFASTVALVQMNFLDMATLIQIVTNIPTAEVVGSISTELMSIPAIVGLILLFLFNNPDKKIGVRLPLGLWELYGFVTGLMGDALSYIRLFALGLAGGLLGMAFNDIAFMISAGDSPKFLVVFTILVLILGHTINFSLSVLGSFVHPLRLTFVEFYKNLNFRGGSKPYKPFMKTKE